MMPFAKIIEGIVDLLYPPVCPCCGKILMSGERIICLSCRLDMPGTGFHLKPEMNPMMEKLITRRAPIERAAAWFFYDKDSPYARLIQRAKYYGRPTLARRLAEEYARILLPTGFFDGIDVMVPVPLSRLKLIRRGYNQSLHICRGLADINGIPIVGALSARSHKSQTRKGAHDRFINAQNTYRAMPAGLRGDGHILLVDDICTTGATICACAQSLSAAAPGAKISVLTLAATRLN